MLDITGLNRFFFLTLFIRKPPCGGYPWGTRQNWMLTGNKQLGGVRNAIGFIALRRRLRELSQAVALVIAGGCIKNGVGRQIHTRKHSIAFQDEKQ